MSAERMRKAYAAADQAIQDLVAAANEERDPEDNEHAETITDWVLVVGSQFFDEDGDRAGVVSLLPRHGSQPAYITSGLLHQALSRYSSRAD